MVGDQNRRRLVFAGLAAATVAAGLVWRFAIPGLPWFAWKYGGSALWAMLLYCLIAFPRVPPWRLLLAACIVATLVEFSRLYHAAWLDAFRATLAGRLTLGRIFSPWNLPAYYCGAVLGWWVDRALVGTGGSCKQPPEPEA